MAPPDQGSGATPTPEAAPAPAAAALKTTDMPCTCGHEEPTMPMPQHHHHERKFSSNTSFSSSLTASPAVSYASSSTTYLPASNKLSCESIPYTGSGPDELGKLSSFSSSSSYESFFHIEALDDDSADFGPGNAATAADNNEFLDFEPCTTRPPAVQTMMPPQQGSRQKAEAAANAAAGYDPKRLPSSMFRTRSTNPAEWSATSNESLFSIQLSSSAADLNARYADFYYDAAGFPRFPSMGRDAAALRQLPSLSESSGRSGGLCVRHDCARCGSGGKTRKSVRFAATESVSGDGNHSHSVVVSTTLAVKETEAPAAAVAAAAATGPAAGWCELGCCLGSSSPTVWWPRCCGGHGCGCHCKWWF